MSHDLLHDPNFFRLLLRIDEELAGAARAAGCPCGGVLHCANYPRKPRACLAEVRSEFESRFSFCCNRCRRRTTAMSVRFLGRRVYLGLAMVLTSARHAGQMSVAAQLATALNVPLRTLKRWRSWWSQHFPLTALWQTACARFMPPLATERMPGNLLERFAGDAAQALMRLLVFLSPITVRTIEIGRASCRERV